MAGLSIKCTSFGFLFLICSAAASAFVAESEEDFRTESGVVRVTDDTINDLLPLPVPENWTTPNPHEYTHDPSVTSILIFVGIVIISAIVVFLNIYFDYRRIRSRMERHHRDCPVRRARAVDIGDFCSWCANNFPGPNWLPRDGSDLFCTECRDRPNYQTINVGSSPANV